MDLSTDGASISPPPVNELYGAGYTAGARVHSNSWTGNIPTSYQQSAVDLYLYEHMVY